MVVIIESDVNIDGWIKFFFKPFLLGILVIFYFPPKSNNPGFET
jgi:hypothetical protein